MIGDILETKITDGAIECTVDFGSSDIAPCILYGLAGVDTYPLPGDQVRASYNNGEWVIDAVFRDVQDGHSPGETIVYSRDEDGNVKATVKVTKDGDVIMNDGTRSAVGFSDLKTAFDQLKADHDAVVSTLNTVINETTVFATAYVPGGPAAVGTPPTYIFTASPESTSTADIDPAESDTVKVP
jgi:hypothetical protein